MDSIKQYKNWKAYMKCKSSTKGCSDVVRYDGAGNVIGIVPIKSTPMQSKVVYLHQKESEPKAEHFQRELRVKATPQELYIFRKIKPMLASKGIKALFQHTIYNEKSFFIIDIYISRAKLAIEIDGKHHMYDQSQRTRDQYRDKTLESMGIQTLRFQNTEIYQDSKKVIEKIMSAVCVRLGVESRTNKDAEALTNVASG